MCSSDLLLLQLDSSTQLGRQFAAMGRTSGTPTDAAVESPFGEVSPPSNIRELAARWQLQLAAVWQAWTELLDEAKQQKREAPKAFPSPSLERLRQLLVGGGGLLDLSESEWSEALPQDERAALAELTAARDRTKSLVPAAAPTAMCMREDKPVQLPVHIQIGRAHV